jgi:hypothetical protein
MTWARKDPQDVAKVRTVRVSDRIHNHITATHGTLADGIKLLAKGGPYEQLIADNERLKIQLAGLNRVASFIKL